jgi:hypothetical protein
LKVCEVAVVHRQDEVRAGEPGCLELAGAVGVAVIAAAGQAVAGALVHRLADVPVAGARAVHDDPVTESGLGERLPGDDLGHRGPADVAQADEAHPVRTAVVARRRHAVVGRHRAIGRRGT